MAFVSDADAELIQAAENVQKHDGQLIHVTQGRSVPGGHGIEPAAATRPAGDGAILAAYLADALADAAWPVVELGGEGPAAHARAVRLDHADDPIEPPRGHAGAAPDAGTGA